MKGKWSSGKILAVVFGSTAAGLVLVLSFCVSVFWLIDRVESIGISVHREHEEHGQNGEEELLEDEKKPLENEPKLFGDGHDIDGGHMADEYYEFHNEIRKNLSYQIQFETYGGYPGYDGNISIIMEYPVVTGADADVLEGINFAIQRELEEVKAYGESVTEWLSEEENFTFEVESYVTYMDEDVLSIIYLEYGYLEGEVYESYVVSVNIDMESKMALTNSQLLHIDDEFSVEFRERCERQNGEIQFFSIFSDQDITSLLTDDESLIIFYTPLGMEVGFNYYYGWVTVTYQDYQKYCSHI